MLDRICNALVVVLGVLLAIFTLSEVNYPLLQPQSRLAVFGLLGIVICFLIYPVHPKLKDILAFRICDFLLIAATVVCFGYVIVQTEPAFKSFWSLGQSLGDRAGAETETDFGIGLLGLLIVLEATRRSIGIALPILAVAFIAHAYYGEVLPDWLLPHAQKNVEAIVNVTFLQSLGVFGPAMNVMFTYVFLFVVFGAFLEITGGTKFIVDFAQRVFARSPGGPAKMAVLGSGLMGSLSGSAVANAVTTGAFTIPMMRNAGFKPHVAGGITAAAASGGALVPPVMGAGAYMMLEIVDPPIDSFLTIAKAALIPAILYYFSIFMIVHFYSYRTGAGQEIATTEGEESKSLLQLLLQFEGIVFFGALFSLVGFLVAGYSPFASVTISLEVILWLGLNRPFHPLVFIGGVLSFLFFRYTPIGFDLAYNKLILSLLYSVLTIILLRVAIWQQGRLTFQMSVDALVKSAKNGVSLVSASACVGIVIGIVQTTGIAGDFNTAIGKVVEHNLLLALIGIMGCSIVLGMGVPSVVCYLLMATLMGNLLKELGVIPLAAHLFIFYFGMMSMVTPPVALAAFASASIAQANIMRTALSSFMFSLVGFTLPFMFIYRPELLLMSNKPEIRVSTPRTEDGSTEAVIPAYLERIAKGLPDRELSIDSPSMNEKARTVITKSDGSFDVKLKPGRWNVRLKQPVEGTADENKPPQTYSVHLGVIDYEPGRTVERIETQTDKDGKETTETVTEDQPVIFVDQRLSVVQVIIATTAGALGIIALAAGIAGYMIRPLNIFLRVLLFATAALLLFPGRGIPVGGEIRLAVSDIAGVVLLLVLAFVNAAFSSAGKQTAAD